jgi:hypothetical protein
LVWWTGECVKASMQGQRNLYREDADTITGGDGKCLKE